MEAQGIWLWQRKFNGDRCIALRDKEGWHIGNRHGKWKPRYELSELRAELDGLDLPAGNHCFDGELMADGTLVLFDVLMLEKYLFGVNQPKRLALLEGVCRSPTELCDTKIAFRVSDRVLMAEHGDSAFLDRFNDFFTYRSGGGPGLKDGGVQDDSNGLVEGLMLRKRDGVLDNWGSSKYEVDWLLRCRVAAKNYSF
jgi:hypothetical protein